MTDLLLRQRVLCVIDLLESATNLTLLRQYLAVCTDAERQWAVPLAAKVEADLRARGDRLLQIAAAPAAPAANQ